VLSASLSFTDANSGDTHTASESLGSATWSAGGSIPAVSNVALVAALTDTISEVADGTSGTLDWSFSLADSFLDFLAVGETLTAVYNVAVSDHHTGSTVSESSTQPVTIVFTGSNDLPVIVPAQTTATGTINELPNQTGQTTPDVASGVVAFSDPDLSDRPTASINFAAQTFSWVDATAHNVTSDLSSAQLAAQLAAIKAALSITPELNTNFGNIDWTFSIQDKQLDFLGVGETLTVTTPLTIDDHHTGTVDQNIVVTLLGANDNPIAVPDSNGTAKKSTLTVDANHGVLSNDTDPDFHDNGHLAVSAVKGAAASVGHSVAGTYGSLTLNGDGSYVYVANQGSLPAKIVAQDTFQYTISDPHGGTATADLYVVVFNPGVQYLAGMNTTLNGSNGPDVVDGFAGHDVVLGGNGPDVLIGGAGDTLTGGNGPDIFLFRPHFGVNTITDFDLNNDALQFDKSMFASVNDVLSHTTNTVNGAVISDVPGDAITLSGVTLAQLQAHTADFYLV
jgi:VCBS repeat-containing protein